MNGKRIPFIHLYPMQLLKFLTALFNSGMGYSAINTVKSALATLVTLPGGQPLGKHPTVLRYIKELEVPWLHERDFRNAAHSAQVQLNLQLLRHLKGLNLSTLTRKQLTLKVTVLLALLSGQRL